MKTCPSRRIAAVWLALALGGLVWASRSPAQTFQVSIGIRETGTSANIGENGGTNNGIEWVNLDAQTLVADGTWQQFSFNFGTATYTAFAGTTANGVLDGTRGTLEHIRIRNISGVTDVLTLWIDDIVNTVNGIPIVVSGFETTDPIPAAVNTEHIFQEPRFSGSTQSFLANLPNATLVSNQDFHSGAQSNKADFAFVTPNPMSWLRLTTFGAPGLVQPNPTIDFTPTGTPSELSFWLKMVIAPPAQRWINPGSGDWDDVNNWGTGVVPNAVGATANFLEDITAPATVTLNNPITVTTIRLQSDFGYSIVGGPANNVLTLNGNAQDARTVNAQKGNHTISAPVVVSLGVGTSASMVFNVSRAQDVLAMTGPLTISITNNATLTVQKTGSGRLDLTRVETVDPVTQPTNLLVSGGTLRLLPGSGRTRVNALSLAGGTVPTSKLDITNNPVVVDYLSASPIATIGAQIASAYNAGAWDGNGITSSLANASQFAVGYAEASSLPSVPAVFGTIDGTEAVLIRLTRYGDANLDGTVSLPDFNRLAANFGSSSANWSTGDFTFDGQVSLPDFNRLAANFGLSAAPDGPTPQDWAALASAVPEPAGALTVLAAALGLRRRRGR